MKDSQTQTLDLEFEKLVLFTFTGKGVEGRVVVVRLLDDVSTA